MLSEVMREMYENGRQQGRSEGIREGNRHGFRVTKAALATKMLKNGYPVAEVVEVTGLGHDEVLRRAADERNSQ